MPKVTAFIIGGLALWAIIASGDLIFHGIVGTLEAIHSSAPSKAIMDPLFGAVGGAASTVVNTVWPPAPAAPPARAASPAAPAASPAHTLLRPDWSEERPDGSVWLVRQWSDGSFEDLKQIKPPTAAAARPAAPAPTAVPVAPAPPAPVKNQPVAPAAPAPAAATWVRRPTGKGNNTLRFSAGEPVVGFKIVLDNGTTHNSCYMANPPTGGNVTDGVAGEVYSGERNNPCQ